MTQDEIIDMARQLKMPYYYQDNTIKDLEKLVAFAKLVAEHEREACAKIADNFAMTSQYKTQRNLAEWCASSIRARGQA
jgi:hypothetical protein